MNIRLFAALAVSAIALASCTSNTDNPVDSGGTVSFASDIRPIIQSNCVSCHAFSATQSSLLNYTSTPYGKKLVIAGNSAGSPLYDKVQLTSNPQHGARMPQGSSLSSAQVTLIKTWIDEGALNN
jgi:uncharacterized membrane protein